VGDRASVTEAATEETTPQRGAPAAASPTVTETVARDDPGRRAATRDVEVQITLICGGITNVKAPVVIGARYDGLAFAGPTKAFDRLLDSWLTRAVDLGIIGSALGQLFLINLEQFQQVGKMKAGNLLLAGMGEPGRFAQDSLQFLISNVVVAVKTMGHRQFASTLIGTRRSELSIGEAIRGFVQGIYDGYERIRAIGDSVTNNEELLRKMAEQPLSVLLVHSDEAKLKQNKPRQRCAAGSES
jgi:hypothetical protein